MASGFSCVLNWCPKLPSGDCKRLLESQFVSELFSVIVERRILTVIVSAIVVQTDFPDCREYPFGEGLTAHKATPLRKRLF